MLKIKDANSRKFIQDLKKSCKQHNIELRLINKDKILSDGVKTGGYFGGDRKIVLGCAVAREDFLEILIHESCHMDQYLYDKEIWEVGNSCDNLFYWLDGERQPNITKHINNVQDLELDCDIKAVAKIKKYKLPINITRYIQKSNAYIYFYAFLRKTRAWPKTKSPHTQPEIWKLMPKKFLKPNKYHKLPKKFEKLFQEYL